MTSEMRKRIRAMYQAKDATGRPRYEVKAIAKHFKVAKSTMLKVVSDLPGRRRRAIKNDVKRAERRSPTSLVVRKLFADDPTLRKIVATVDSVQITRMREEVVEE